MGDRGQELSELWHSLIDACRASESTRVIDTGTFLVHLARDQGPARSVVAKCGITPEVLGEQNATLDLAEAGDTAGASEAVWQSLFIGQDFWLPGPVSLLPLLSLASPRHQLEGTSPTRASILIDHFPSGGREFVRQVLFAAGAEPEAPPAPWEAWGERHLRRRDLRDLDRMRRLLQEETAELPKMSLAYLDASPTEVAWMASALEDGKKWLVAALAEHTGFLHAALERPMADAGALETNPSFNRTFIEIAMWASGPAAVLARLQELMQSGDPATESGAAQALYWVRSVGGLAAPVSELVQLFLNSPNIDTQRRLIANLTSLDKTKLARADLSLLENAVAFARAHRDDYVRHRAAIFDGTENLFFPLPPQEV